FTTDRRENGLTGQLLAEVVQQEEAEEEDHGDDEGHPDASFADDGSQGRTDEKHHQAGYGHGQFLMPGHLALDDIVFFDIVQCYGLEDTDLGGVDSAEGVFDDAHPD